MKRKDDRQTGFSPVELVVVLGVVVVLGAAGWMVYQHQKRTSKPKASTTTSQTTNQQQSTSSTQPQKGASQNWATYTDTGAAATGITFKYPTDWEISIPGPGAKGAGNTTNPTARIGVRGIFLPTVETPQDEWNTCATKISGDACGAAPGDNTLSGSESTVNGYAVYTATMQNSYGTYYVAVIRGNKATSDGIPFVELTTYSTNPTLLNTFTAVVATASFPN